MAGGYENPTMGFEENLTRILKATKRELREVGRPSGSAQADALQQLRDLINGVLEQTDVNVAGDVTAGGDIHAAGDIYTPHGRTTPVVTSYVSAYIQGPDGRIGATPSARRFKTNSHPKTYDLEQIMLAQVIVYQLRALVGRLGKNAPWEVGVLAEQMVHAGLSEFVAFGEDGRPFSVHYERLSVLALSGVQQLYRRLQNVEERLEQAGF